MGNLSTMGRIFYGTAIAETGFQTIYYNDFPYWLLPPKHLFPGLAAVAYISGTILMVAGACIVLGKQAKPVSLLLAGVLLSVFCFYYLPYEFMDSARYMQLLKWDSALKELAIASGGLVIAGCFSGTNENSLIRFLERLIPFGRIFFSITMVIFGTLHLLYAEGVATYVPSWIPNPVFWTYVAGVALLGSGIAIISKIKIRLFATLLGTMILTWFIILHVPKVITAPAAYFSGELTSAFLALAYSGIAFVIAHADLKKW